MISYAKLWKLLERKGLNKSYLREFIAPGTVAKLGKNDKVSLDVIEKLCEKLDCQPGDIMEYVSEKTVEELQLQLNTMRNLLVTALKEQGIEKDKFIEDARNQAYASIEAITGEDERWNHFIDQQMEYIFSMLDKSENK